MLHKIFRKLQKHKLARYIFKPFIPTIVPVTPELWASATINYDFVQRLSLEDQARLRHLASVFLSRKAISGAAGQQITDLIRIQIAAQACILILNLGMDYYDGWHEIIVYPAQFTTEHETVDAAGVVHRTRSTLSGEAWLQGPVVLSYRGQPVPPADFLLAVPGDLPARHPDGPPPCRRKYVQRAAFRAIFHSSIAGDSCP